MCLQHSDGKKIHFQILHFYRSKVSTPLPGATAIPQPAHLKFCWLISAFLLKDNAETQINNSYTDHRKVTVHFDLSFYLLQKTN